RAAVASAFNDPTAESQLQALTRAGAKSEAGEDAFALLCQLYIRTGQYARYASTFKLWADAFPTSERVTRERENLDKFGTRPNQMNGLMRRITVKSQRDGYITLPVTINGKTDNFFLDTGAWQSAMTEKEAR